ncbi:MAG: neutral/alkaline non-lysosomal ceramidase N-terminal domain-containing protein, partial [Clostridia bacterium]|nr:neutral/alkaline non-lysosomal ceramidase N-terminal domain-containing protein [Clostridia bacterium]
VRDKLYARAMAISNGEDTVVMMSLDMISVVEQVVEGILKRASEYTGIPEENMNVSCTHTHTGGPRPGMKDGVPQGDDAYEEHLIRIAGDCIILAVQNLEPATLKFGTGCVDNISFNRVYNMADGHIQTAPDIGDPNVVEPNGPIDPELTVLYAESLSGKPLGTVVNFACHPDVVKGTKYSGDWPSIVAYRLKEQFGTDFIGFVINGTCGNINHVDVINGKEYPPSEHYITMGNTVAAEAVKAIASSTPVEGSKIAGKKATLTIPARTFEPELLEWARHIVATVKPIPGLTLGLNSGNQEQEDLCTAKSLLHLYENRVDNYTRRVGSMRIGDVYFYSLPSEIFVQFGLYLKENSPSRKNIIAELSHGYSGYVPLKHLIFETVYESRRTSFPLEPGAGELMTETALQLGKSLAD